MGWHLCPRYVTLEQKSQTNRDEPRNGPKTKDSASSLAQWRKEREQTTQPSQQPKADNDLAKGTQLQAGKAHAHDPDTARNFIAAAQPKLDRMQEFPSLHSRVEIIRSQRSHPFCGHIAQHPGPQNKRGPHQAKGK